MTTGRINQVANNFLDARPAAPRRHDARNTDPHDQKQGTNTPRCDRAHVVIVRCPRRARTFQPACTTHASRGDCSGEHLRPSRSLWVERAEWKHVQSRCRPSLSGCRLYGTVRASIRFLRARRTVSGPSHVWTAMPEYRQQRSRNRAVAWSPFLHVWTRLALPPTLSPAECGSHVDTMLGHLSHPN